MDFQGDSIRQLDAVAPRLLRCREPNLAAFDLGVWTGEGKENAEPPVKRKRLDLKLHLYVIGYGCIVIITLSQVTYMYNLKKAPDVP